MKRCKPLLYIKKQTAACQLNEPVKQISLYLHFNCMTVHEFFSVILFK